MSQPIKIPPFVKIKGIEMRLTHSTYYRDTGDWHIGFKIVDGKLYSWTDNKHLDCCKIEEITKEEYIQANKDYLPKNFDSYPHSYQHDVNNYVLDVKKYKDLIDKKSGDISDPFWFNRYNIENLPKRLQDKFIEVMEDECEDFDIEGSITFSYDSIYHLWDIFVGKAFKDLSAAYFETWEYKNGGNEEVGARSIVSFENYIDELRDELIDGCGSSECDDYEYCHYSGEILCSFGRNEEMIKEEIDCIAEQEELSQRDFNFLYLVDANYHITIFKPLFNLFDKAIDNDRNKSI